MYEPRRESTRRAMEDSSTDLERLRIDEYHSELQALQAMLTKVTKQAMLTKRSFQEIDKAVAVLSERIKWIWYVVAAILGVLAFLAKGIFTWGLGKF